MTEIEEWRPVEGYEGLYEVSNLGRVKSIGYGKERILKPVIDKDGYPMVNLYREGKRKTVRVHRLVGITFIPNPDNLPVINHKNEIKTDSRAENLEWTTVKGNTCYGTGLEHMVQTKIEKGLADSDTCGMVEKGLTKKEYDRVYHRLKYMKDKIKKNR